jgi:osmoprotectant transport system ATP-binding protein
MNSSTAPSLRFDAISVSYGGADVLRSVSLTIDPGELVVLLGPSGSGKTTLLRTVNRMVEPTTGRVLIDGQDAASHAPVSLRRSIGYVMQASGLFPHRTVLENVATVPRLLGASKTSARATALVTLERVGLDAGLASRFPAQLSGGQQQRVGVARAIAADPGILLMDEPFGALDPITRRVLQHETRQLQARTGATILFVTHDVDEALALGDRIIVLDAGGRIAQDATPTDILTQPADAFVAELVGVARGDRALRLQTIGGKAVVSDRTGRPLGVLEA